jgi:hypothetical protein
MIPTEYDLRMVEFRYGELRKEASTYRLAQDFRTALVPGPSIIARIRSLISRSGSHRPLPRQAEATA